MRRPGPSLTTERARPPAPGPRDVARTYWRLFAAGVWRQSTYRLAALGGLVANTTFGLLKVALLLATLRAAGGELKGYDAASVSAYIWVSQGLLGSVNLNGRSDVAVRIRTGEIAVDFLRPLHVQAATVTTEVGEQVFSLLPRGVPPVVIGLLLTGMTMPTTAAPYLLGALSVLLGITLSCACVYLVSACGFWLLEVRGLQVLYMVVSGFLAGLFVPVPFFPDWLERAASLTPFPSMLMTPVEVLTGRVDIGASAVLVALQVLWLALAVVVGALMTRAGRRRLEVQGG